MDFTYVRTWAGWAYVAFILDVYSQRIVAWHAHTSKHVDLVMTALRMALWERERQGHPHSAQAATSTFGCRVPVHCRDLHRKTRPGWDSVPLIGTIGDAYDNALMETINGLYKAECIRTTVFHDGPYKTPRRREIRNRWMGRLVQQPQAPRQPRNAPTHRI